MIATWMLSAALFTLLLGVAASCAEWALRAAHRPARWVWLAALASSITWPALAPWIRRAMPASGSVHTFAARMPTIYVVPDRVPAAISWTQRLDTVLLVLWAAATLVLLARLVRAVVLLVRMKRGTEPHELDGVPVLLSANAGPAVIGLVSPRVLFPKTLLDLDAMHRRLVLAHEQEHCRARDPWLVFASAVALALVPWNLPLWWIARRARLALEIDCDARVLGSATDVSTYGKLLMLISQRQAAMTLSPMLAATPSQLERRIIAMQESRTPRRSLRVAGGFAAALIVAGAACASRIGDRVAGPTAAVVKQPSPVAMANDHVYFEFEVEKLARQLPGSGMIRYPDSLRVAKVGGEVLAQFVVDTAGRYESGSFKMLTSTHPLFTRAVANALPLMRFEAAQVGGHPVQQLVQQPFTFAVSAPDDGLPASIVAAAAAAAKLAPAAEPTKRSEYREFKLDKMATQIVGYGAPDYPDSLRMAKVSGEVLAQFVVEQNGRYMEGSYKVLKSSHPLFSEAVRDAMPRLRFEPAMVHGRAVKQLVQMPFTFSVSANQNSATVVQRVEYLPLVAKPLQRE